MNFVRCCFLQRIFCLWIYYRLIFHKFHQLIVNNVWNAAFKCDRFALFISFIYILSLSTQFCRIKDYNDFGKRVQKSTIVTISKMALFSRIFAQNSLANSNNFPQSQKWGVKKALQFQKRSSALQKALAN